MFQHCKIYAVCEDHSLVEKKEAKEAANSIVAVDPKSGTQKTLVSVSSFNEINGLWM